MLAIGKIHPPFVVLSEYPAVGMMELLHHGFAENARPPDADRTSIVKPRKEKTMPASTVSYGVFEIVVRPERNEFGAWFASVTVSRGAGTVVHTCPMTIQPAWLTEEEAIRDGVEWGRRFIDREFNTPRSHSWVAGRSHAEHWFRDAGESRNAGSGT